MPEIASTSFSDHNTTTADRPAGMGDEEAATDPEGGGLHEAKTETAETSATVG